MIPTTHGTALSDEARDLALALHRIGALQFGAFTLKSGKQSPFYVDMRLLISYPDVLALGAAVLAQTIMASHIAYERLAAIPYAGLPIGTALSLHTRQPMIFPRKEKKDYGTAKQIEGEFAAGERVLVIDDVITTGGAKLEAIAPLRAAGLEIAGVAVLLDRESGGLEMLATAGLSVIAALRLRPMLDALHAAGKIDSAARQMIEAWLAG